MRVTQKYILKKCCEIFERLEITHLKPIEIVKTRYYPADYENGAACYIVTIGDSKGDPLPIPLRMNIYYPIWFLQQELNNGYELYLKPKDRDYLYGAEFDIRKAT